MPPSMNGSGSAIRATSAMQAATAMLTHHGERSRIANSDFSDILNFMCVRPAWND